MRFKELFLKTFMANKIEFLLMFLATLPFLLDDFNKFQVYRVFYAFSGISFCIVYLLNGTKFYKFTPILIAILYALLWRYQDTAKYFVEQKYTLEFSILNLIFFIMILAFPFYKDDKKFITSIIKTVVMLAYAFIIMLGVYGLIAGFFASFSYLFDVHLGSSMYSNTFFALFYSLFVGMFLYLKSLDMKMIASPIFVIIFNIISIFLLLYTALLYLYIILIVITFELPRGMLSSIILPYMCFGVLFYCLKELYVGRFLLLYRYFWLIAIAPLVMLFIGVIRRIDDYGFTPERFYLLAASILVAIFAFFIFLKVRVRVFVISLMIALAATFFAFDATKISINSQLVRLNSMLESLEATEQNGTIKTQFNINKLDKDTASNLQDLAYDIYRLYNYNRANLYIMYGEKAIDDILSFSYPSNSYHTFKLAEKSSIEIPGGYNSVMYISDYNFYDEIIRIIKDEKVILNFNANEFIAEVFQKNGLDVSRPYTDDELSKFNDSFLFKDYENGTLIFTSFAITYSGDRYKISRAGQVFFLAK